MSPSTLRLLEQIRAIAQTGLHYAKDPYDLARYRQLFDLSLEQYAELTDIEVGQVRAAFAKEAGNISPKTAASGAIFNDAGHILLVRRADDGKWTVPGGACDAGESPRETAVREVREETGLAVAAHQVIEVFCGRAGVDNRLFTIHSTMYYCTVISGDYGPTLEATAVAYRDHRTLADDEWHRDFKTRVAAAHTFWLDNIKGKTT